MASRKSEIQRASNIRRKLKDGEKVSKDDIDFLSAYDKNKKKPGRPVGSVAKKDEPPPVAAALSDDDDDGDSAPNDLADAAPISEPLPPPDSLPPPPKVVVSAPSGGGKSSSGDWRAKYRQAEKGGSGREHTCQLVAGYWVGALVNVADALKAADIDPIIKPEDLVPAIVLTVDELLPDHVEISPRVMAVGGSSALLVQRFIRREEVAKAKAKAKDREAHQQWKEHRKETKEPEPTPPPPPTPAADENHAPHVNGVAPAGQMILEVVPFDPNDPEQVF